MNEMEYDRGRWQAKAMMEGRRDDEAFLVFNARQSRQWALEAATLEECDWWLGYESEFIIALQEEFVS